MAQSQQQAIILERRERLFFLTMAIAITAAVVSCFGLFFMAGFSSFDAPLPVHIHAVTFMSWVFLYLAQNVLIFVNKPALHRKLGWVGVWLAGWVVVVGLFTAYQSAASGNTPPIFTPASLFALNLMMVLTFGGLAFAAIAARKKTDWHRRLMLCATLCVITPAFGRLLILMQSRTHLNLMIVVLSCVMIGVVFDLLTYRKVHPAYGWGCGAIIVMGLTIQLLPAFPPFIALLEAIAGK